MIQTIRNYKGETIHFTKSPGEEWHVLYQKQAEGYTYFEFPEAAMFEEKGFASCYFLTKGDYLSTKKSQWKNEVLSGNVPYAIDFQTWLSVDNDSNYQTLDHWMVLLEEEEQMRLETLYEEELKHELSSYPFYA